MLPQGKSTSTPLPMPMRAPSTLASQFPTPLSSGGALASHTLTLQVVISQAPVVPPTPIVLTTTQIAELEENLEDFEEMDQDN